LWKEVEGERLYRRVEAHIRRTTSHPLSIEAVESRKVVILNINIPPPLLIVPSTFQLIEATYNQQSPGENTGDPSATLMPE
jgi:hypothetical protein